MTTTYPNGITNTEDIIDSRDVIERIAELEDEDYGPLDQAEAYELDQLRALRDEASGYAADWEYGEALIRDSYFEDYARDLADDIGAIDKDATWPVCHIDWEAAAESLQMDYTSVEYMGETYWIR